MGSRAPRISVFVVLFLVVSSWAGTARAEIVNGTSNPEFLVGSNGDDEMNGLQGADVIVGMKGDDSIDDDSTTGGDQLIFLGKGEDFGWGNGPGRNIIFDDDGSQGPNGIFGDTMGTDSAAKQIIHTVDGFTREFVECSDTAEDVVAVDNVSEIQNPEECEWIIDGTASNKRTYFGRWVTYGTNSAQTIKGKDKVYSEPDWSGNSLGDLIYGRGGDDVVKGRQGNDDLFGGAGVDKLVGGPGNDVHVDDDGTAGDALKGGPGADTFYAADGAKTTINCGVDSDTDLVYKDPIDTMTNCGGTDVVFGGL